MKKIFLYLLNRYSSNEKGRIEILTFLSEKVSEEYNEQTPFGNVYNYNTEFLMSNELICELVYKGDNNGLKMIKSGLEETFDESIKFIKAEPKRKLRESKLKELGII